MDRNLRAFLAVARRGNLTAASEEIGLTQPAVTKTIRRLEDDLGIELFERSARGMHLNDAGRRFLERAEVIEAQYRFAREEMVAERREEKARLRVVAGVAYQAGAAVRLAGALAEEFPRTQIELGAGLLERAMPELIAGEIDLALGAMAEAPAEGVIMHPLLRVDMRVFAGPRNPLFHARRVALSDLSDHAWVAFGGGEEIQTRLRHRLFDVLRTVPRVPVITHNVESCLDVVRETDLLMAAVGPVQRLADQRGLRRLPLPGPLWSYESGAWLRDSSLRFPVVRRALDLLDQICAPMRGLDAPRAKAS